MISLLVLEPLPERGIKLFVCDGSRFFHESIIEHGQDIVAAIDKISKRVPRITGIVVRSRVGSFSASRSVLVAGNVLCATRNIPLYITEADISSPEFIMNAIGRKTDTFAYEREPHITKPQQTT